MVDGGNNLQVLVVAQSRTFLSTAPELNVVQYPPVRQDRSQRLLKSHQRTPHTASDRPKTLEKVSVL